MDNASLDEADELLAGAREVAAAGRPSAAWADLLRACAIYEDLHRPWDVASVDVVLGGQNVQPVAEGHDAAWERLLADVGWTPGAPAPLSNLTVRCLGEEHEVAITEDWRMLPVLSRGQRAEHVAAALVGEEPFCTTLGRKIDTIRAWAAPRQRLHPWMVSWSEPDLERWELPQVDRAGWASDGDDPSGLPLPVGPVGELLGALPATHPSEAARLLAAPHVVGGVAGIDWLWRRGVHPDLACAIHAAVGVDEPIDRAAVARLVVRRVVHPVDRTGRVSGVREWSDDPLPVGCLVELLGDAVGERRLSMLRFLAAAGGARDADDPSRLLAWWAAQDLPDQARMTLHRAGFERSDLTRWAKNWGGVSEVQLAHVLQGTPPGRWPLTVWADLPGYLAQVHRDRAAVRQGIPSRCEALREPLEEAAASGDARRILAVAGRIDRQHPADDPLRAKCPVWITAGVQAMVALSAEHPRTAASVLAALRGAAGKSRPEPLLDEAEWVWVALERQAGRLVPLPPTSEESAEHIFSLLEHRPAPPDVPKAQWLAHFGSVVDRVWSRLRMAGVTLEQALRWQPPGFERSPEYVMWLADFQPYPWPVGQSPDDPIAWLVKEGRRRARRWACDDHSRLHREEAALEEQETLACLEDLHPALEAALAGNDPAQVDNAAREVLRGHTYYHALKSYRYHLDSCPVAQLARLVLGVQTYPADRPSSWELLTGDRDDPDSDGVVEQRYTSALCMVAWLALNLGEGRLVKDDHLAAKWKAAADRSVDGRWLLRVVLEAFAAAV